SSVFRVNVLGRLVLKDSLQFPETLRSKLILCPDPVFCRGRSQSHPIQKRSRLTAMSGMPPHPSNVGCRAAMGFSVVRHAARSAAIILAEVAVAVAARRRVAGRIAVRRAASAAVNPAQVWNRLL